MRNWQKTKFVKRITRKRRQSYYTKDNYGNSWDTVKQYKPSCCEICKKNTSLLIPHHIIPLSKGGSSALINIMFICEQCHNTKHAHLFKDRWRQIIHE